MGEYKVDPEELKRGLDWLANKLTHDPSVGMDTPDGILYSFRSTDLSDQAVVNHAEAIHKAIEEARTKAFDEAIEEVDWYLTGGEPGIISALEKLRDKETKEDET